MSVTLYTPIRIGRSDGETEIRSKKHGKEVNGPSTDQMDRIANPDDFYELLEPDHPTAIEWKRVLGGLLQRELGGRSDQKWFLVVFPENYRLFRHVRATRDQNGHHVDPGVSRTKSSRKSEEVYLYGYPIGHKRRYKSATDFFPHLMWLAEDKSEDYGDCTCKFCSPDWVQKIEPLPGRDVVVQASSQAPAVKKEASSARKEIVVSKKEQSPGKKDSTFVVPRVVIKQRPTAQDQNPKSSGKKPTTINLANTSARPNQPAAQITPIAPPRSQEQAEDAQFQKYIYRHGEVTWFNRGSAWGLCVVVKRDMFMDAQNRPHPRYLVQPLSHPFEHPVMKVVTSEDDLRPWLAWSAPNATHTALVGTQHHYNNIDWKGVVEGRYGGGDSEVDGSIFAARMIDDSFTLIEPLSNNTTTTGERSYNALYLGGEKIWLGEPVRVRINQGQDIMVIHQIIEKLKPGSTNIALATVHVVGDIYRYVTTPSQHPTVPDATTSMAHLPVRMQEDLKFRNRVNGPKKFTVSQWKLVQSQARLNVAELKGRWYESSTLLPVLRGAQAFQADLARGEVADVGTWMNARQDANLAGGRLGTRIKDRIEAFARSVPEGLKIGDTGAKSERDVSSVAMVPNEMQGAGGASLALGPGMGVGGGGKSVTGVSDGDIAEFMDLDQMEEGFTKDYVDANNGRP